MDLSKAFDTINYQLLIAKLYAYCFSKNALELILNYLSDRWYRTKINASFSSLSDLFHGVSFEVSEASEAVLGPLPFNIYLMIYFMKSLILISVILLTTPHHMPVMLIYQLSYIT